MIKTELFLSVKRLGGPKRRKSCSKGVANKQEKFAMFGTPNLIVRIYAFTPIEYLRLFGRIRGLS